MGILSDNTPRLSVLKRLSVSFSTCFAKSNRLVLEMNSKRFTVCSRTTYSFYPREFSTQREGLFISDSNLNSGICSSVSCFLFLLKPQCVRFGKILCVTFQNTLLECVYVGGRNGHQILNPSFPFTFPSLSVGTHLFYTFFSL